MNVLCNATNGIINFGSSLGNKALVQGLGTVYHTLSGPPNLVTYIRDFLQVSIYGPIIDQYNTIMSEATDKNSSIYAGSWIGPPAAQYSSTNQTLAIFTLVNAAQVGRERLWRFQLLVSWTPAKIGTALHNGCQCLFTQLIQHSHKGLLVHNTCNRVYRCDHNATHEHGSNLGAGKVAGLMRMHNLNRSPTIGPINLKALEKNMTNTLPKITLNPNDSVHTPSSGDNCRPYDTNDNQFKSPNVYINCLPLHYPEDQLFELCSLFGEIQSMRSFTRYAGEKESLKQSKQPKKMHPISLSIQKPSSDISKVPSMPYTQNQPLLLQLGSDTGTGYTHGIRVQYYLGAGAVSNFMRRLALSRDLNLKC
ncbi:hypothetical protein BT96DRAFT_949530 [Gymnopus androsaceus JB14]|uniref:RRM domain-containing protein n=1 Tax=Gymnopus androsaceus JB14 TaxID=1447944 RepID=A0A6A4GJR7_9AGAR|nr:hypothetical protein BT96DRAFT_949530 [Gymnopus androsaceus JB14]